MTREWVDEKTAEYEKEVEERTENVVKTIMYFPLLSKSEKNRFANSIRNEQVMISLQTMIDINSVIEEDIEKRNMWEKFQEDLDIDAYRIMIHWYPLPYENLLDSDPVHFKGDIIITDPCYFYCCERSHSNICDPFMERDTIYGDWGCTTYDDNTGEVLGRFCADSGMVGVYLLDDVLEYNPSFDFHITKPHTTTWIRDFDGTVQFVVSEYEYTFKNEKRTGYELQVVGRGVNMVNGRRVDFTTVQTSF